VDPGVTQTADWFRKAANQGFAPAQVKLEKLYSSGRDVPQDNVQAIAWLQKAADQRDGRANSCSGLLMSVELGTRRSAAAV
jgi:TPR repeat protein